jgi:hypothetical protein
VLQHDNEVGVAAVCRFIACILHSVQLTDLSFSHCQQPSAWVSACVGHDAWKSEGLPGPPRQLEHWDLRYRSLVFSWPAMLRFLRVFLAQFRDSMSPVLNAASALLVIGRGSLPVHALLHPDQPALLGAMLSRRSLGRSFLQRWHFSSDGRLQLLRCSCPLSALLLRLVSVINHSGRAMVQHDRHKLLARIMKRYFSIQPKFYSF